MNLKKSPLSIKILCLILSFLIPACLVTNFMLNHFYVRGGYILDSGWFAYLSTYATGFPLSNPDIMHGSYFDIHFSPIFYLYIGFHDLLSFLGFNLASPVFFSLTQGIWFGILSLSCYILFLPKKNQRKNINIFLAFLISLLTLFNGISLSIIGYPHFEIGIPALLLAFFALWLKGFKKASIIPLFLCLLMREDAGLHCFGVFFLLALYFYFSRGDEKNKKCAKNFLYLAVLCFIYAVCVVAIQRICWGHNALSRVYLGAPPFSHINSAFLRERIHKILTQRAYIYMPLILLMFLSILRKNLFLLMGVLAVVPWLLLSFFAISQSAGTLMSYYAYPVLIALFWPIIAFGFSGSFVKNTRSYHSYWKDALAILMTSFLIFFGTHVIALHPIRDFNFKWIGHVKNTQTILDQFLEKNALHAQFIVDTAAAAIELDKLNSENMYKTVETWSDADLEKLDLAIFKPKAFKEEEIAYLIQKAGLTNRCSLEDTAFILATKPNDPLKFCIKYRESA